MDLRRAVHHVLAKAVGGQEGIKVLLLDQETTAIVSTAVTQSFLLSHDVFLTDRVDNRRRDRMIHLKCIAFLRPSQDSITALVDELRNPKYGEYYLIFVSTLTKSAIERLAEADVKELVKEVEEYYADFCAVGQELFSLNLSPNRLFGSTPTIWEQPALDRCLEACISLLLALKKKPAIRFERMSAMAKRLGQEIAAKVETESSLFDFRPSAVQPQLLILDRRNDPVTPLLSQWTYQAMVHELIGIKNGRVSLSHVPGISSELEEVVLSADQDPFYAANLYANFGDLGANIKAYVDSYQAKAHTNRKVETVQDMKRFVEEYPEFRKLGGNVSKHVALVEELSRRVETDKMLEVSELEQSLACNESHNQDLKNLLRLVGSELNASAKLRLALLYALRYQKQPGNSIGLVMDALRQAGLEETQINLVHVVLNLAGADQRQDDLFANENLFARGRSALKGLRGVENVYTQHTPHLAQTLDLLVKGRLKESSYPFVETTEKRMAAVGAATPAAVHDVIVFVIGGVTYEEARAVALLNAKALEAAVSGPTAPPDVQRLAHVRVVLGGTSIINSQEFLAGLADVATKSPTYSKPPSLAPSQPNGSRRPGDGQMGVENLERFAREAFGKVRQGVDRVRGEL